MFASSVHQFMTDEGSYSIMLVGDTIVAYHEHGDTIVHQVPPRQHDGPTRVGHLFQALHLVDGLVVARIRHATDLVIGFYNVNIEDACDWGYTWDLHHADQSAWRPATDIAGMIDPRDLPIVSRLADIGPGGRSPGR